MQESLGMTILKMVLLFFIAIFIAINTITTNELQEKVNRMETTGVPNAATPAATPNSPAGAASPAYFLPNGTFVMPNVKTVTIQQPDGRIITYTAQDLEQGKVAPANGNVNQPNQPANAGN